MIEVKKLTKKYGNNTVVDHISFSLSENQVLGFLGPNGAGKSTTMNMITGSLEISEGSVIINGKDILEDPQSARRAIGYLPELPPLYMELTPIEYLSFVGEAKGIPRGELKASVDKVMAQVQITHMGKRLIKNLSKGYKQRVGIAQAILGNPQIIILDEPTVGLDPKQIIEVRDLIKDLGKEHIVIFSSHILSEVFHVCDHAIIIAKGKIVANCPINQLTEKAENLERIFLALTEGEQDADNL